MVSPSKMAVFNPRYPGTYPNSTPADRPYPARPGFPLWGGDKLTLREGQVIPHAETRARYIGGSDRGVELLLESGNDAAVGYWSIYDHVLAVADVRGRFVVGRPGVIIRSS